MAEKLKFGAFIIIVLIFFLLVLKKNKQRADFFILVWCTFFTVHLITINYRHTLPAAWFYLNEVISFLHGFMLYYYISLNVREVVSYKKMLVQLFSLVLGSLLLLMTAGANYWQYPLLIITIKGLVSGAYIVMVLLKIFKKSISQRSWYLFLTIGLAVLVLLPIFSAVLNYGLFISQQNAIGNVAYCFFIVLLGFFGIGIEPVFVNRYIESGVLKSVKYSSSSLSETQRAEIFNRMDTLIDEEELYTYTDLTLAIMSRRIGHNSNRISESINHQAKCNFNDYINQKRIAAFKAKIDKKEHIQKTLLSLAFECGFNSKTSFNRIFKKHMNSTPTQFVRAKS